MVQHVVFFPVDEETLKYLKFSGRDQDTIDLVENYSKAQGFWQAMIWFLLILYL